MNEYFYRVKFAGHPQESYAWATTALEAIAISRQEILNAWQDTYTKQRLGNATARRTAYKEWDYSTDRYTIGGDFIQRVCECGDCSDTPRDQRPSPIDSEPVITRMMSNAEDAW